MVVAVIGHGPAGFRAMVAIVDDAHTIVDGIADGRGTGTAAFMELGDMFVGVVFQCVADEVDVLVVVFAIVAATGANSTDTKALVDPSKGFRHVTFIVKHLVDLVGQMGFILH